MREPLAFYQVDAFADEPFAGNPAAVCLNETWLPDDVMQAIAAENNLSETAFLVPEGEGWALRWFTPTTEVDLCGHATLAAAAVLFDGEDDDDDLVFATASGPLRVRRTGDIFELDFPAIPPLPLTGAPPAALIEGLGRAPSEVLDAGHNFLCVFGSEGEVAALTPDFGTLGTLGDKRVIATAPGASADVDFVSRFFAPTVGVDEDPVTGSAHCSLAPFWADRLGQTTLEARQISARGGALQVEDRGGRVLLRGRAVIVIRGEFFA